MKHKTQNNPSQRPVGLWRSCLQLLVALAIIGCTTMAQAALQTDLWTGAGADNSWGTAGNWAGSVAPLNAGDLLIFSNAVGTKLVPTNNLAGRLVTSITFAVPVTPATNGYTISGLGINLTNGIVDNTGSNTISLALTNSASQIWANNAGGASNSQTTVSGGVNLLGSDLSLNSGNIFVTGAIFSTNGGTVTVNGGIQRLAASNWFGMNTIIITNLFTLSSYTTNVTYFTNFFSNSIPVTIITNTVITTNGTYAYTTNQPSNHPHVVTVSGGILELGNTWAIPGGLSINPTSSFGDVGNVQIDGTLDLNGQNANMNGLDGGGTVDNGVSPSVVTPSTGSYVLNLGYANSNGVFGGNIQNTAGSVGLSKWGWGTQEIDGSANTYSGPTTINQGTLLVGASGSLGSASTLLTIQSGAVLDVTPSGSFGYIPAGALNVSAGTPSKPYTNFLGSFNPQYPNFVVTTSATNFTFVTNETIVAGVSTNFTYTTNLATVPYVFSTNSIISVINYDVQGNFNVAGNGSINPVTSISPGIATWSINGNLTIDNNIGFGVPNNLNRVNFLLNNTTTAGGGTNDLIDVNGTLSIGDELDFVVSPLTGTLAAGKYTLIKSLSYVNSSPNDGNPANLVLIAPRGITGTFDTTSHAGWIQLTAGGTAAPGLLVWAATSTANNSWDTHVTKNWTNSASSGYDYYFSLDNVSFGDTGVGSTPAFGVINLPLPVSPSSVTFNNNNTNYVFNRSQSTFITGAGGLTKNGLGSVTLQNPNSFTGDVTVNGGTLTVGYFAATGFNQQSLWNAVAPGNLILGGGTINQASQNDSGPVTEINNLTINPGASTITQAGRGANELPIYEVSNNVTRAVGGVLNVTVSGRATSRAGLYFLSTNSPDGAADYGTNGLLGAWAYYGANDWFYANQAYMTANANGAYRAYQNDNNPANWGSHSNVLVGGNVPTSPTIINITSSTTINSLRLTNAAPVQLNISGGQTLTLSSGGILLPSGSGSFASSISGGTLLGAPSTDLIVNNNNNIAGSSLTIGSLIADNGGATGLTTAGGGTTILTGNNNYTGPTYINAGFAGTAAGTLQVGANGTSGSIASSSAVVDNGSLAFNRSDNTSVGGVISGIGSLKKLSAGVLTLTANNTLSGAVTVSAGTLELGNGGTSGSVSNAASIINNGTLTFNNSGTAGYPNPISGFGNLVQFGSGTLIVPTNETYSGVTVVSNGTMTLTSSGSISNTTAIVVRSTGILDVTAVSGGGLTLRSAAPAEILAGRGRINGSITTATGTTLSPATNGVIGTLIITNNLTLNGGNFVFDVSNGGSDSNSVGNILTETAGTVIINVTGGALANGVYPLMHAASISGSAANLGLFGFVQPGQIGVLTNEASGNLSLLVYSGTIPALAWWGNNPGGANNNWDLISADWTNIITGGALGLYVNPDYALFDDTIGSFSSPIDIQTAVSSTVVTVNATNSGFVFGLNSGSANKITGGSQLVKNGPGTLTLQTTNDYLGGTVINGGVVQLGNNIAQSSDGLPGGNGPITLNGTLVASNFATETISGPISGSGQIVQMGVGKLVLAADNSGFSGGIWATNLLQMGNGFTGTLGTGPVTNNKALLFNVGPTPSSAVTVSANISGAGGITNIGVGTVTLSGNNTYAGNTIIPTGTIVLGSDTAIPKTTAIIMDNNTSPGLTGSLDLNGHNLNIASLLGNNTGNGLATLVEGKIYNNGSGTATLTIGGGSNTTINAQLLDNINGGTGVLALMVTNGSTLAINSCYNNLNLLPYPNLFSGGIIISNATVFEETTTGTAEPVGTFATGSGTITMLGGHDTTVTNSVTRMPTNAVLYAYGNGNANPTVSSTVNLINIPAGESGAIFGPCRGSFNSSLTGGGTIMLSTEYVRAQWNVGDGGFTGTVILAGLNVGASAGGNFPLNNPAGWPNAAVVLMSSNLSTVQICGTVGGNVLQWGSLNGGDNSIQLCGGTNPGSEGSANTIYAFGNLNSNTVVGCQFIDGGVGIRKLGTGTTTLTNYVLSYGGQTVVSNGTLAFSPGTATNTLLASTATTYLVGTNFTIVAPGIMDVSGVGNTLYLGHNGGQTLWGNGTLNGNLTTTNSTISPGKHASDAATYPGHLTVTGTATINKGSNFRMSINRTNSPVYDSFTATGGLTINQANFVVLNAGDTAYPPQTTNVFQFFAAAVPVNLGGTVGITNIALPALAAGQYWITNLAVDGSMAIANTNLAITVSTTPFTLTNSYAGGSLTLAWPLDHTGYRLQAQTNTLSVGISNNWVTVSSAGGVNPALTNKVIIPVDTANGSVFYRLIYP